MNKKEIEIQVKLGDGKPLLEFLGKNADFKGEYHQIDEYYTPPHKDFSASRPVNEWLRLRDSEGQYSINYKYWHYDGDEKSRYCDEYESRIEDIDTLRKIFKALDFRSVVTVDKYRKIWIYKHFEITMDDVKNLGDFVEIEYIGESTNLNPAEINKEMINFLKDVGCKDIQRNYVGYAFSLMARDEVKWEEQ
ncbi:MAG TPA: class IV adenylate cyclase [Candidatus Paceibacterota bacterium]